MADPTRTHAQRALVCNNIQSAMDLTLKLAQLLQNPIAMLLREIDADTPDDVHRVGNTAAGEILHNIQGNLAVAPRIHEDGVEADIARQDSQPQ